MALAIVAQLRNNRDNRLDSTEIYKSQVEQFKEYLRNRVLRGNKKALRRLLEGSFGLINLVQEILGKDSILTIDNVQRLEISIDQEVESFELGFYRDY